MNPCALGGGGGLEERSTGAACVSERRYEWVPYAAVAGLTGEETRHRKGRLQQRELAARGWNRLVQPGVPSARAGCWGPAGRGRADKSVAAWQLHWMPALLCHPGLRATRMELAPGPWERTPGVGRQHANNPSDDHKRFGLGRQPPGARSRTSWPCAASAWRLLGRGALRGSAMPAPAHRRK